MKAYYVKYRTWQCADEKGLQVLADNKEQAYDKAMFEDIPRVEGTTPYSCWVERVTYNNGNWKHFNTFEGKPY